MQVDVDIQVAGEEEVARMLRTLDGIEFLSPAMRQILSLIRQKLTIDPQPVKRTGHNKMWLGEKRRKYVFYALAHGLIEIPYRRTGALAAGWDERIDLRPGNLEGEVANQVPYSPWVVTAAKQARVHQKRWPTVERTSQQIQSPARHIVDAYVEKWAAEHSARGV